ncbi:MAG: lipopolysaccharide biosynthesis protein, partial [Actinophytocola sp.]|uniref:lipopolysaccharide biosynthesis protein n=1 Tax=Actinophytocola sp. TaxID=1872138 RepID=UPI003D6BF934
PATVPAVAPAEPRTGADVAQAAASAAEPAESTEPSVGVDVAAASAAAPIDRAEPSAGVDAMRASSAAVPAERFEPPAGTPTARATSPVDRAEPSADAATAPPSPAAAPVTVGRMARALSYLVGGTALMLVVMNLAPIVVTPRLAGDAATAAAFASAFVLARIPLFLFAPVQAVLLPALTRAATRGELGEVRTTLRRILLAVAVIGCAGALASFTVGPWAVQVLFGAEVRLSGAVVGLLGVGTVGLMAAQILQPGLVALGRHRVVTGAWLAGTVVLVTLLALPGDPIRAGVIAQLAAAAVVTTAMSTVLHRALGRRDRKTKCLVGAGVRSGEQ